MPPKEEFVLELLRYLTAASQSEQKTLRTNITRHSSTWDLSTSTEQR